MIETLFCNNIKHFVADWRTDLFYWTEIPDRVLHVDSIIVRYGFCLYTLKWRSSHGALIYKLSRLGSILQYDE